MIKHWRQLSYSTKLFILGTSSLIPWVILSILSAAGVSITTAGWIIIISFSVISSCYSLYRLHLLTYEPFNYCSNIISSLRQGDYSMRSRQSEQNDALGILYTELNLLGEDLRENRLLKLEENRRFQLLINRLEVAVLGIDDNEQLILINEEAAKWFGDTPDKFLGKSAQALGIERTLTTQAENTLELNLPARKSRFLLHIANYREDGRPCKLLVLTDLKNPLREEERRAWKSLIRVISHEVNNSITPISSLASSVNRRIEINDSLASETKAELSEALEIISNRASNMTRFIKDFASMAKLPPPQLKELSLRSLISSTAHLGWPSEIEVTDDEELKIAGDEAQLQQALINLIQNAFDAAPSENPRISITWGRLASDVKIKIKDNGPGISDTQNLFVPFFTTKSKGSGIGLVVSREIIENHHGSLQLQNHPEGGCEAIISLPLI